MLIKPEKFIISVAFLVLFPTLSETKNIQFKLAVRVLDEQSAGTTLNKADFSLLVNGRSTPIIDVVRKEKSLDKKPDLGRDFILSFHLTEYGKHVENGISYLITEVLDTSDSLIILSPINIYKIQVSPNKGQMIKTIRGLLENDSEEFRKQIKSNENQFLNRFNSLKVLLGETDLLDSREIAQSRYVQVSQFLSSFPKEYENFKTIFLMPNINHYQQAFDSIEIGEKEIWWIHFQQKEVHQVLSGLKDVSKRIKDYIAKEAQAHAQTLQSGLSYLETQTRISDSFPERHLLNTVVSHNANYNVIFFRSEENKEAESGYSAYSDLETILERITRAGGGIAVNTTDSEQGMLKIDKHVDSYYELIYDWNGQIEEKRFQVLVKNSQVDLSYIENLSEERIESLVNFLSRQKVSIDNISISKYDLAFVIKNFDSQEKENFGLLKIRVQLYNPQGHLAYNVENILRASKNEVNISLTFGTEYRGRYRLVLTACDLIANRLTTVTKPITIE